MRTKQGSDVEAVGDTATGPKVPTPNTWDRLRDRRGRLARAVALTAVDTVAWASALAAAVVLRYELEMSQIEVDSPGWLVLAAAVTQASFCGIVVFRRGHPIGSFPDAVDAARAVAVTGFVVFALNVLAEPLMVPRSVPLIAMPIALLIALGARVGVRAIAERTARRRSVSGRRTIIFGAGTEGQHLLRSLLDDPGRGYLPVALLDDDPRLRRRRFAGVTVQGTRADLAAVAGEFDADLLLVAGLPSATVDLAEMVQAATDAGLQVMMLPPLVEILRPATGSPQDVAPRRSLAVSPAQIMLKRATDIALCLLALPIVLPVLLIVSVVLAITQREVLYRAQRVGRYGKTFTMLKFATMRADDSGPRVTRQSDPRITPIGGWLRATKLNELPQIFNVLRGDMSIVGPRPEDPSYAAHYSIEQRQVLRLRPGMTSLAYLEFGDEQIFIERAMPADIEAYYVHSLLPQKLVIELQYMRNCSITRDLGIILRTFRLMFR